MKPAARKRQCFISFVPGRYLMHVYLYIQDTDIHALLLHTVWKVYASILNKPNIKFGWIKCVSQVQAQIANRFLANLTFENGHQTYKCFASQKYKSQMSHNGNESIVDKWALWFISVIQGNPGKKYFYIPSMMFPKSGCGDLWSYIWCQYGRLYMVEHCEANISDTSMTDSSTESLFGQFV